MKMAKSGVAPKFEIETVHKVYDNDSGDYISVGPDADGLGLIENMLVEDGKIVSRMSMPREQAVLVVEAMQRALGLNQANSPIIASGFVPIGQTVGEHFLTDAP
jgi:hypothetical protein